MSADRAFLRGLEGIACDVVLRRLTEALSVCNVAELSAAADDVDAR